MVCFCAGFTTGSILFYFVSMISGQFNRFNFDYPDYSLYPKYLNPNNFQQQQQQQSIINQFNNNNNGFNDFDYNDFANNDFNNNQQPRPRPTPRPTPRTTTTTGTTTTRQPLLLQRCLRNCPTTSEYNPVCGTNGQSYNNRNVMRCAQACGVNVQIYRLGPCVPRPL